MRFIRINNVNEHHDIFKNITENFEWYNHESIMIIPDPISAPRRNWYQELFLCKQNIDCPGKFVVFFHFINYKNQLYYATSLTLPEFLHIKYGLNIK
ncbi:hypothetical protein [Companilactobacillus furfuricola]|uniref:hypothetical protein n=1 Tax=Companilactobacillus furfuricola TaxID=1462575 RepID=UPI000F76B8A1|nr:hypothetical protein [Companilactobacillus furfuricola]